MPGFFPLFSIRLRGVFGERVRRINRDAVLLQSDVQHKLGIRGMSIL
jgi:hypothetical protein